MRRRFSVFSIMLIVANLAAGATWAWQPAKGPLMTRWSRTFRPKRRWPEYPRPQMVREKWTNLNGLWDYAIRPKAEEQPEAMGRRDPRAVSRRVGAQRREEAGEAGRAALVSPHVSSPAACGQAECCCTSAPSIGSARCGSTASRSAHHTGGYDPFTFDITDALKPDGRERTGRRRLGSDRYRHSAARQAGAQAAGIMYTAVTGIWQTVWLEPVPSRHIRIAQD